MFISIKSFEFLEYCFKCSHKKASFTCGANLCDKEHGTPCIVCSNNKYKNVPGLEENYYKPNEILECNDFEEIKK